jgi:hypothetical protein
MAVPKLGKIQPSQKKHGGQASEFGIVQGGQKLAGLLIFITDTHALGLKAAQGLIFTALHRAGDGAKRKSAASARHAGIVACRAVATMAISPAPG